MSRSCGPDSSISGLAHSAKVRWRIQHSSHRSFIRARSSCELPGSRNAPKCRTTCCHARSGLSEGVAQASKVLTFHVARLGAAIVTGIGFFIMIAVFIGAVVLGLGDRVTTLQACWLCVIVLSSVPAFAAHAASTSFLDAYALNKFQLPPMAAGVLGPAAGPTINPWRHALVLTGVIGFPLAALSYWWVARTWPDDSFSALSFVMWISACSGVVSAVVIFARTGGAFVREVAVPKERRRFPGTLEAYLWQRHAIPQLLLNAWYNGWAGLTMVQGPVSNPSSSLSRSDVLIEALLTGCFLALGIAAGTRGYAGFDARWGVAPELPARGPAPSSLRFTGQLLGFTLCAWLVLCVVMFGLSIERVYTWPLVVWRALLFGAFSGVLGYWSAYWTLAISEPSPAAVESELEVASAPELASK
jgi:hypothetical protein